MGVGMSQKTFSLVAGVVFLLVALGHALRVAFGASVVIQNTPIPMWVSWVALIVAGYLAYQGFRLSRKSLTGM
jgi:threonine/homoserine/homoserine lactone efflux protein